MRHYTLIASALGLTMSAGLASASDYNSELNAGLGKTTVESPLFDDQKITTTDVSGTYYFNGVNTRNHPFAEAAFLERASSITLTYSSSRWRFNDSIYFDGSYLGQGNIKADNDLASVDIDFYLANSIFYFGGSVNEEKIEVNFNVTANGETESGSFDDDQGSFWTLRAGIAPADGLLIWSEFFKDQETSDEWNLNAKYVFTWGGNAVNLEAAYDTSLNDDTLYLAADYYLDRSLSLGVLYENSENWDNNFGLRARKHFTDNFSLEASYLTSENYESYRAGLALRF